jgi:uncharacterized membrane protein
MTRYDEDDEIGVHMDYKTLDERFTHTADKVSEALGSWWFSFLSLLLLIAWTLYGALVLGTQIHDWFTSQAWNFPLNTITTVGEWFITALVAAAANRVERRHNQLLREIKTHGLIDLYTTREDVKTTERAERATRQVETDIRKLSEDMQVIKRMLAKVVTE